MKSSKKFILFSVVISCLFLFFSCGSTATMTTSPAPTSSEKSGSKSLGSSGGIASNSAGNLSGSIKKSAVPVKLGEPPLIDFTGDSLQIELANMYYDGFELVEDENASKSYALKLLNSSSCASAKIAFPAGTYEGIVNVLSPDSNHSRFNVCINDNCYLVYGSEPPIGKYELTTRSVVSFTLDKETIVDLKIQQNDSNNPANNGQSGMTIDYIIFKKVN